VVALDPALRTWRAAAEARTADGRAHWRAREAAVETERRDIVGCDERRRGVAALSRPDVSTGNELLDFTTATHGPFVVGLADSQSHVWVYSLFTAYIIIYLLSFFLSPTTTSSPSNMANGKKLADSHASQHSALKVPLPTDKPITMAQPAKPKSSTSEVMKTQTKRQKITRYIDSDDEDDELPISKSTQPKTAESKPVKSKANITRPQVTQKPSESDDEDEEAESESEDEEDEEAESESEDDEDDQEDSEDDQTNGKKPVKATSSNTKEQAPSKKSAAKKRALDSDDEDVVYQKSNPKKTKSKAYSKKIAVHDTDSEDEVIELPNKPTKSKPKATRKQPIKVIEKQPIKPTNTTPTKKKQIFTTSKAPVPATSSSEEDSSSDEEHPKITLTERKGDLFAAPPNTLLIHACNCVGSWNAGIALAFQKTYPAAYAIYQSHCSSRTPNSLLSTCLLIQPQPGDKPNHWIGCLFTSRKFGRGKDSKEEILDSTDSALQDMLEQLEDGKKKPKGVWMCKINSGSFKVPWMQTKKLIEALSFKGGLHIEVVDKK
jgi:ADP-ribose 1''-phosphate phosphatase